VLGAESAALVTEFLQLVTARGIQPSPVFGVATYYRASRFEFKDDVRGRRRIGDAWLLCQYRPSSHGEGGSSGLCVFMDGTVGLGELSHPTTYRRHAHEVWARNGIQHFPATQYEYPKGIRRLGAVLFRERP
jgi:hypothetical protein